MAQRRYNDGAAPMTGPVNGEQISAARGVSIDSGALGAAAEVPMLDDSGARAMGQGYAQLGEGIKDIAAPFVKLAEHQAMLVNSNHVSEADNVMTAAQFALQEQFEKEHDERKWPQIAQETAARTGEVLGKMDLSRAARDEVDSRYASWKTRMDGQARVLSARKSEDKFKENWMGVYKASVDQANLPAANEATRVLRDAGVITDGARDALDEDAKQGVETSKKRQTAKLYDARLNQITAASKLMPPEQLREQLKYPGFTEGLDPADVENLRRQTESLINFNKGQAVESTANRIWAPPDDKNRIKTDSEIDAINDPNITDLDKKKLKHELAMRNQPEYQEWMVKNAPYIAANLSISIDKYKVAHDEAEHGGAHVTAMNLRQQIARLPEGMRSHLSQRLYNREYPGRKTATGPGSVFDMGDDLLRVDFHSEGFGKSGRAAGSLALDDPNADTSKDTPEKRDARTIAKRNYSKAREEWRQWTEAHPDAITFDGDAEKKFREIEAKYLLDGAVAAPASVAEPSLFPTVPGGAASGINSDVKAVLERYSAPAAEEAPASKQSNPGIQPEIPLPGDEAAGDGNTQPEEDILLTPPSPEFAGEGMVPLTPGKVASYEKRGLETITVMDRRTHVWRQVTLKEAKKGDYLVAP